jgi:hypothetical protein
MTREQAKQEIEILKKRLELLEAYANGKIQLASLVKDGDWEDIVEPTLDGPVDNYHIKPEPRRFWINVYKDIYKTHTSSSQAKIARDEYFRLFWWNCLETIEVVEVVK